MLYFPQLQSGATVQYPFIKHTCHRTASNSLLDGRVLKLTDPGATLIEWELAFESLTERERLGLEGFFRSVEGRLLEFTFLDPSENLLRWSDNLSAEEWLRDPSLTFSEGMPDPAGGTCATKIINASSAPRSIQQTIDAPGWFHYCFSFYAKSEASTRIEVFRSTAGNGDSRTYLLDSGWRRVMISGASQSTAESVTFGIRLQGGVSVDVHGFMAEAQPGATDYRKTTSRNGIYKSARFGDDLLAMTSEGPEQHSCRVRIVAPAAK